MSHVIFSLSIIADSPIAEFEGVSGRSRAGRTDDDFMWSFGRVSLDDADSDARADRLDEAIHTAIDRLEATGVDLDLLTEENVVVRAHFSFSAGPETISAAAVARLARIHATIWIDAS